jgi:glycosyltransferase involved in cell wall biosynthesis
LTNITTISVILGIKNSVYTIRRALKSVIEQKDHGVQIIVVDGESTDGTIEILEEYEKSIDVLVIEKDSCYAEAWNKGISAATGDLIAILNADDYIPTGQLKYIRKKADLSAKVVYYGDVIEIERISGKVMKRSTGKFRSRFLHFGFGFMHTTCIVPKIVFDDIGLFCEQYKYGADTDWLLRCHKSGIQFKYLGNRICMSKGGLTDQNYLKSFDEYLKALKYHGYGNIMINIAKAYSRIKNIAYKMTG